MKLKRMIYVGLGLICLALGTVGAFVPILPTVPFYLATAFFFGRSSERLDKWFKQTDLYKKHLESFVMKKGMLLKTKIMILVSVTVVMGFGFYMMKHVLGGRIILAIVWLAHVVYFIFGVKTIPEVKPENNCSSNRND